MTPAFIVHDVEQRSEAWYALRAGLVTGSCAPAITAVRKKGTGELAIRRDARQRKVCEILTGVTAERDIRSSSLTHGLDTEPDAVAAYEAATGQIVQRVGFISHATLRAGCSPDGYVGDFTGIVEAKCPNSTTHLEYLQANVIPEEYEGQLLHALWLTGAEWADFVSFDPRFHPEHLRLFIKRMHRDAAVIQAYELALVIFLREVEASVAKLAGQEVAA